MGSENEQYPIWGRGNSKISESWDKGKAVGTYREKS